MLFDCRQNDGSASFLLFCQTLRVCAIWAQSATAVPQEVTDLKSSASIIPAPAHTKLTASQTSGFGFSPSEASRTNVISSAPKIPEPVFSGVIPSATSIESGPASSGLIPSAPIVPDHAPPNLPSNLIPSATNAPNSIPSASDINIISSLNVGLELSTQTASFSSDTTAYGAGTSMALTDEGLRPILALATELGDPDGHHEISEPNFTSTALCQGCSPVIEISRTGFFDWGTTAVADHARTSSTSTPVPSKATITAGPSQIIISKEATGGNFVIGELTTTPSGQTFVVHKTTISAGQTIFIDHTPMAIQISGASTKILIGTIALPLTLVPEDPCAPVPLNLQSTSESIPAPVVLASQTIPDPSNLVYTSTLAPLLTLFSNNQVFTANRAGYYVLAPGTTLVPGGPVVTVYGTTVSLGSMGTAVVVQGSTRCLAPLTTVVMVTGWGGAGETTYSGVPYNLSSTAPVSAGIGASTKVGGGLLESVFLLGVVGIGWLAVWL